MNGVAIVLLCSFFLLGFGAVQSIRLESYKDELIRTKNSLYGCLDENKKNEKTIELLTVKSEKIEKNIKQITALNASAKKETDNKIAKIISSHVPVDCESAVQWGAKESSKIAEHFNNH